MEKILIISDHIWEDVINVILTDDINATIKHNAEVNNFNPDKYLTDHADAVCLDIEEPGFNSCALIFDISKINVGRIVHETNHLTYNILDKRDVPLNDETMEVYAYTQTWLFNKVYDFWVEFEKNKV
jgi:hypothetical protein